ncbi:MAG TPA: ATPase, T2SS/T4P/T4SS family [Ktedonobacterales bacterium]|nr:ATPase, T2SS/T4P/T4SS family [Ktedonobacterales bacterium]
MFDPRSPYQRRMWHYESDRPLSIAQLVAAGSLDTRTAALLWLLVQRHQSFIVSGPTDPTPGVGKTTTLNALLGFLPAGSTVVYTMGMFEDFGFVSEVEPATTCVLANEISDHLRIYMWGKPARTLLRLPQSGFAVASSCHADTIDDVMAMLTRDLRLGTEDVRRLGVIVNIGLVGEMWPPRRRFVTTHFILPDGGDDEPWGARLLRLSAWREASDDFERADEGVMRELAAALRMAPDELEAAVARRMERLAPLVTGRGVGLQATRQVVDALWSEECGEPEPDPDSEAEEEAE